MITNISISPDWQSQGLHRGRALAAKLNRRIKLLITVAVAAMATASICADFFNDFRAAAKERLTRTAVGFPDSTPITLNPTATQLWVTNPDPDNNSVTVIDVTDDSGRILSEIPVGKEPNSVAIGGDDRRAYVANTINRVRHS